MILKIDFFKNQKKTISLIQKIRGERIRSYAVIAVIPGGPEVIECKNVTYYFEAPFLLVGVVQ